MSLVNDYVAFSRGNTSEISNTPLIDGQFCVSINGNSANLYLDNVQMVDGVETVIRSQISGGSSSTTQPYTLPTASSSALGGVKIKDFVGTGDNRRASGIEIEDDGTIKVTDAVLSTYTLPTASTSTLGGVKVDGTTVTINNSGVISAVGSGSSSSTNNILDYTATTPTQIGYWTNSSYPVVREIIGCEISEIENSMMGLYHEFHTDALDAIKNEENEDYDAVVTVGLKVYYYSQDTNCFVEFKPCVVTGNVASDSVAFANERLIFDDNNYCAQIIVCEDRLSDIGDDLDLFDIDPTFKPILCVIDYIPYNTKTKRPDNSGDVF